MFLKKLFAKPYGYYKDRGDRQFAEERFAEARTFYLEALERPPPAAFTATSTLPIRPQLIEPSSETRRVWSSSGATAGHRPCRRSRRRGESPPADSFSAGSQSSTRGAHLSMEYRGGLASSAAILLVLAAMLLPALSSAKARGKRIACVNNTRQFLLAAHLYANDNEQRLPSGASDSNTPDGVTDDAVPILGRPFRSSRQSEMGRSTLGIRVVPPMRLHAGSTIFTPGIPF